MQLGLSERNSTASLHSDLRRHGFENKSAEKNSIRANLERVSSADSGEVYARTYLVHTRHEANTPFCSANCFGPSIVFCPSIVFDPSILFGTSIMFDPSILFGPSFLIDPYILFSPHKLPLCSAHPFYSAHPLCLAHPLCVQHNNSVSL